MRAPLWVPTEAVRSRAAITRFMDLVNQRHGLALRGYDELLRWSTEQIPDFWAAVWDFVEVKASRRFDAVVDDLGKFPGARWFPGARLNFAENLLRWNDDRPALLYRREDGMSARMTYAELRQSVAELAAALRQAGIRPGDRVACYMPSLPETAVAMLACTSIGGVWSSCGAELGSAAVADRLGQIAPRLLFTSDGYWYKGKPRSLLPNVARVARDLPTVEKIVVVPALAPEPEIGGIENAVLLGDFLPRRAAALEFEQLPFDHPVYIMFSSGTTGKPKCMAQGPGVLINHLKELVIHTDLGPQDTILYLTSPSWMMWNWLLSSLAVGAAIVLFDGSPTTPDGNAMWKLAEQERITIFGCSASYLNSLSAAGISPGGRYDLSALRGMSQTGSSLSAAGFEYVYRHIKEDLHFNSISGGTDINGCFAIGSPIQPVYAGEVQGAGLGMKVKAYDEAGRPVVDQEGELVCEAPAPSMPLSFWGDADGAKYRDAYFTRYPGAWRHGDWVRFHGDTGGVTFLGRSDFTLKPAGVRIGPAEIYSVVQGIDGVADSLVVGQEWQGDQRVILFVAMAPGRKLTEELRHEICDRLRREASPRHVPSVILETDAVPYTSNMKKVEGAVANILNGKPVTNRDSLANPECLSFYEQAAIRLRGP